MSADATLSQQSLEPLQEPTSDRRGPSESEEHGKSARIESSWRRQISGLRQRATSKAGELLAWMPVQIPWSRLLLLPFWRMAVARASIPIVWALGLMSSKRGFVATVVLCGLALALLVLSRPLPQIETELPVDDPVLVFQDEPTHANEQTAFNTGGNGTSSLTGADTGQSTGSGNQSLTDNTGRGGPFFAPGERFSTSSPQPVERLSPETTGSLRSARGAWLTGTIEDVDSTAAPGRMAIRRESLHLRR